MSLHLDAEVAKELRRAYDEFHEHQRTLEKRGWKVTVNSRTKALIIKRELRL